MSKGLRWPLWSPKLQRDPVTSGNDLCCCGFDPFDPTVNFHTEKKKNPNFVLENDCRLTRKWRSFTIVPFIIKSLGQSPSRVCNRRSLNGHWSPQGGPGSLCSLSEAITQKDYPKVLFLVLPSPSIFPVDLPLPLPSLLFSPFSLPSPLFSAFLLQAFISLCFSSNFGCL